MRMGAYVECNFLSIFFFQSTKAQQFRITDNEERAMADDKCFQTQTIRILKPQMKRMQLANSDTQEKTHVLHRTFYDDPACHPRQTNCHSMADREGD